MGIYLNPGAGKFLEALNSEIYVDKSGLIAYTNKVLGTKQKYVCVSRPRRFGKSMAADMLSAYYDRSNDSEKLFNALNISRDASYEDYLNKYDVVKINMQSFLSQSHSISELLEFLKEDISEELVNEYCDVKINSRRGLSNAFDKVYIETQRKFIIIIDEWDCIFREYRDDNKAQEQYLDFMRDWMKDKDYIGLAYMTGILPIKKYGTHSALNMFSEFSMEDPGPLSEYVGFTEIEVRKLCNKYSLEFDECKAWYNGYYFPESGPVYNPNSIVRAMLSHRFSDYWNQTENYEALRIYIDMNFDGLRDAILRMMAGDRQVINTGSFQNDMTSFANADDVMTLLIHLGYLGYDFDTKEVFIPNREIMQEFITATTAKNSWDEIIKSVKNSQKLIEATWLGDAEKVASYIENAHLETSHLQYNDDNSLSYTISLAYYAARQYYTLVREIPTGKGFADLAFIPRKKYADKPAMIVELKWNKDAETAITQIKDKRYPLGLTEYKDNMLLVGINYNRETRKHVCIIEEYKYR